jgi:hypothetical protein
MKNKKLHQLYTAITKAADSGRTLVVTISTATPDRSKDIVVPTGMVYDNYMKNPVVMLGHDYYGHPTPIAKCLEIKVSDTGVTAMVQFPDEGISADSDLVYSLAKDGYMNAWSIGFLGLEYENNELGGRTFTKWELYEFSAVAIPDNPEALTVLRGKGFDVEALKTSGIVDTKKDADNPTDPGYTDDTKIVDLTVKQLKNLIDECLDAEELEEDAAEDAADGGTDEGSEDEGKAGKVDVTKSGRTISAKHQEVLTKAVDHIGASMDLVKQVLDTVATDDGQDDGKSMPQGLIKRLHRELVKSDQQIGFTLRLLKQAKN